MIKQVKERIVGVGVIRQSWSTYIASPDIGGKTSGDWPGFHEPSRGMSQDKKKVITVCTIVFPRIQTVVIY